MIPVDLFSMIIGIVIGIIATLCVVFRDSIFDFDDSNKQTTKQQDKVLKQWIEAISHDHAA